MKCPCGDEGLGELSGIHKETCPRRFKVGERVIYRGDNEVWRAEGVVTDVTDKGVFVLYKNISMGICPVITNPRSLKHAMSL